MGLVPLLGTLMTGVSTSKEEIERLRALGRGKKVSFWKRVNERSSGRQRGMERMND
jgi:hypothetical protein